MTEQPGDTEDVRTDQGRRATDDQISDDQLPDEPADDVLEAEDTADDTAEAMAGDPADDTGADDAEVADEETQTEVVTDMESVVEAILFASDEPLAAARLVNIVETGSVKQIRQCVRNLNSKYAAGNCAFRIEQIAGGYQMMTLPPYNHWLKKLLPGQTDALRNHQEVP